MTFCIYKKTWGVEINMESTLELTILSVELTESTLPGLCTRTGRRQSPQSHLNWLSHHLLLRKGTQSSIQFLSRDQNPSFIRTWYWFLSISRWKLQSFCICSLQSEVRQLYSIASRRRMIDELHQRTYDRGVLASSKENLRLLLILKCMHPLDHLGTANNHPFQASTSRSIQLSPHHVEGGSTHSLLDSSWLISDRSSSSGGPLCSLFNTADSNTSQLGHRTKLMINTEKLTTISRERVFILITCSLTRPPHMFTIYIHY